MKQFIILILLVTSVFAKDGSKLTFAKNPAPYAAIGDDIYSNVESIEKLVDLVEYYADKKKIEVYAYNVTIAKKMGFEVEARNKNVSASEYLKTLRELSKEYKSFLRKVYGAFFRSMSEQNSVLFSEMINSGLIDTKAHKEKIMSYYMKHQEEVITEGTIQKYLDDDAKLLGNVNKYKALTKAQKDAARVKRLRAKDKAQREAREKTLEQELIQKKLDIRATQKKELSN